MGLVHDTYYQLLAQSV
jgi:hypothetical protein